ncbi:S-layer protein domain-containing protein [Methanosarcina hadiensis]|uniref:S-layer protein domain-containing protein n=1 Tax=Methanosarcina hadiensis TaxID=3078083 RepID=UPI0039776364
MGTRKYTTAFCLFLIMWLLCGTVASQATDSTGDRIWDENASQSLNYTWMPQTYSSFYYDLDTGEGSENLTVRLTEGSRNIDTDRLLYETEPFETEFEYNEWDFYEAIGFMGERYFAGYTNNSSFVRSNINLISYGQLSQVLIDSDDRTTLYTGSSLELEEGYALNIVDVSGNQNLVHVQLLRDGAVIDDSFISSNADYIYETTLGTAQNVPLIAIHFSRIFRGPETDAIFTTGTFQVSDQYMEINAGDDFETMEVSSVSSSGVSMRNNEAISLSRGSTVNIMDNFSFIVADADSLRFAPVVNMSEPGTYELRGTVYDEMFNTTTWTPYNFEGFYYNIDQNISTETLSIQQLNGRSIDSDMLVYSTEPTLVEFDHEEWGSYEVLGFMAEKYFSGYPENTLGNSNGVNILSNSIISKVLVEDDNRKTMFRDSSLELEEGYVLNVVDVSGNQNLVHVQLLRDGAVIDDSFISSNADYVYETNLSTAQNVPLIAIHFSRIFRGTETDAVFVQGIFQISEGYLRLHTGESFDEMEVSSVSDSGIILRNKDPISLTRDEVIDLMGNVKFRVADSPVLRFYPFVNLRSAEGDQLEIDMPDTLIVGQEAEIVVTARNVSVSEVNVQVNGNIIGLTGDEGTLNYTPDREDNFTISATKTGYVSGSRNVTVAGQES